MWNSSEYHAVEASTLDDKQCLKTRSHDCFGDSQHGDLRLYLPPFTLVLTLLTGRVNPIIEVPTYQFGAFQLSNSLSIDLNAAIWLWLIWNTQHYGSGQKGTVCMSSGYDDHVDIRIPYKPAGNSSSNAS